MATKQQFNSFEELLTGSETPILVDFYATWCGPCQMMSGFLDLAKDDLDGTVKIVKIDVDKYPEIASQYSITALPTLVLFKESQPVDKIEGVIRPNQLVDRVRTFL
ncbi:MULTISPECIES: thioredoxin [Leptolyngbya]|jgi:thioredoxin|uniref:Thioredoxin n=2 Tax=Leptolyngbya boryana TaxID=1184 RepID=A0A1Z4JD09_LEPBY|nr:MULTISPECIES: thioredoxin [Leptolyngbya]BAY54590.1 thioredoxin [Leptolyngbya boryana NIES-2135]MBD1859821.1 thioredoxin [Leptolyngbya sp. FACHB-1624]MBD2365582.1 thioredoxin [Leptolyngbya sp. FACHB-161]MBD2371762.1 thioredoxin [Leptolyngbya sp. FACHB-238]MBD2396187.1 thioredoxin [Leptolyngbya sp. FACHB-239]